MSEIKKLNLPNDGSQLREIETAQSVLFIGANGAGKTRLGTWIDSDSPQKQAVHRISAQKSLRFPDSATPKSIVLAQNSLLFGHDSYSYQHKNNRWNGPPATSFQDDFEKFI